ncbi:MAG: M20/M25/M40 family metallo-hydrolase, partial [Thermoanaerobaculia bacterium]|nr:M20/M25/M40 family metallo-hydrolase [Thermoanaerobaculia bacterium]
MSRALFSSLLTLLLALALPFPGAADGLQPVERRMAEEIEGQRAEALELLEELVTINSGTMNLEGVREVGRRLRPHFERLGFQVSWVSGTEFQRAGHLVARRAGDGPKILLIGHLDTVFEPDSPFQDLEHLPDDRLKGPGVIDMKGGIVVMLQALEALRGQELLDQLDLTVVLTGDEEKPGNPISAAREALFEAGKRAEIALAFEDGDGDPETAVIARRGSSSWLLETTGTPAHSSQVFSEAVGSGAIYEAARILYAFHSELSGEVKLTFNPGLIAGGTEVTFDAEEARATSFGKNNVVAGRVVVPGDLRAVSPEQLEEARSTMREIVAENLPGTEAEISFEDHYPPMAPSEGNRKLLALYDQVSRDLGLGPVNPVDPRDAGAADVSFVAEDVEMA